MTPEEKAQQIIEKFGYIPYIDNNGRPRSVYHFRNDSIVCALVTVDEVLEAIKYIEKDTAPYYELVPEGQEFEWHYISYWNKVRETLKEQL